MLINYCIPAVSIFYSSALSSFYKYYYKIEIDTSRYSLYYLEQLFYYNGKEYQQTH